jgi:hypothetical protein
MQYNNVNTKKYGQQSDTVSIALEDTGIYILTTH